MPISELARLFEAKRITGAPVVDDFGKLIGVVSETDLMRLGACQEGSRGGSGFKPAPTKHDFKPIEQDGISEGGVDSEEFSESTEKTVDDIMTPWTCLLDWYAIGT